MVRDARDTGMEADGMTVKEMDARLDEIERELDEIRSKTLLDNFCTGCPHIRVKAMETMEYGIVCRQEHAACPAGFSPADGANGDCPRFAEFDALFDSLDALMEEHERISAMYMEA